MITNLPLDTTKEIEIKQFFDRYYQTEVTFPAGEIDAVVGFFQRRDFDITSARTTAIVLLNQARLDNVNVFELLDTLKSFPALQLNQIVAQVINAYRQKTSLIGFRIAVPENTYEIRNVLV
jgi:hypothetical protein